MRTFRAHFAQRGTLAVNGGGQLLYEGCGRSSRRFAAGCWLLAAGCWLLAAGCWLLAASVI